MSELWAEAVSTEVLAEGSEDLAEGSTVNNTDLSTQMTIGGVVCLRVLSLARHHCRLCRARRCDGANER